MTESLVSPWQTLIETYSAPAPQSAPRSGGSSHSGGPVTPEWMVQGLVDRGIPQHIAEGFVPNADDESNFDPSINEIEPLVPGSRGGFGLFQWTGPRRKQLERFAETRGSSVGDADTQLDFLVWELNNTEKSAYNSMLKTGSSGEAASVIVNKFLRPAAKHRQRRSARYLKGVEVPAATPAADYSRLWLGLGDS